jgi:hypothetical protein
VRPPLHGEGEIVMVVVREVVVGEKEKKEGGRERSEE